MASGTGFNSNSLKIQYRNEKFDSYGPQVDNFRPSTFVSSRAKRAEKYQQAIQDYMDEDDGLLGGKLQAKKEVDSFQNKVKGPSLPDQSNFSKALLSDLIPEPTDTMGKKILLLMGWKPGQAVGPRKIRGETEIHASIDLSLLPSRAIDENMVTYASREDASTAVIPNPKDDYCGLGFMKSRGLHGILDDDNDDDDENNRRYIIKDILGNKKNTSSTSQKRKSKRNLSYLDDEDIAYDNDQFFQEIADEIDGEDAIIEKQNKSQKSKYPNLVKPFRAENTTCISDNKPPLDGFSISLYQEIPPYYPPPEIPRDFTPFHQFPSHLQRQSQEKNKKLESLASFNSKVSATSKLNIRNQLLSDDYSTSNFEENKLEETKKSIFNLLKPADRQRIQNLASKLSTNHDFPYESQQEDPPENNIAIAPTSTVSIEVNRPLLVQPSLLQTTFAGLSQSFKNRFVTSSMEGNDPATTGTIISGTEGMKTSEEFVKINNDLKEKQAKQVSTISTPDKQHQKPYRITFSWTPSTLLCKRCNIRPPEVNSNLPANSSNKISSKDQDSNDLFVRLLTDNNISESGKGSEAAIKKVELSNAHLEKDFEKEDVYQKPIQFNKDDLQSIFEDDVDVNTDQNMTKPETSFSELQPTNQNSLNSFPLQSQNSDPINISPLAAPVFIPKHLRQGNNQPKTTLTSTSSGILSGIGRPNPRGLIKPPVSVEKKSSMKFQYEESDGDLNEEVLPSSLSLLNEKSFKVPALAPSIQEREIKVQEAIDEIDSDEERRKRLKRKKFRT